MAYQAQGPPELRQFKTTLAAAGAKALKDGVGSGAVKEFLEEYCAVYHPVGHSCSKPAVIWTQDELAGLARMISEVYELRERQLEVEREAARLDETLACADKIRRAVFFGIFPIIFAIKLTRVRYEIAARAW